MPQPKSKVPLPDLRLLGRRRDISIQSLVLIVIIVVVVIVITTVVIIMVEFCGGLGLRLLSQNLYSRRQYQRPPYTVLSYSSSSELTIVDTTAIAYRQNLVFLLGLGWHNM